MRQTPAIPDTCQWAIFLRNHDELTLEMVTDQERDYLWNFYAADRRARINLGIRRRLAPLLERDRRRIELMNGLLLSMPGTPVVYYGDEIGMGDNIHLGDRDGVRTPMQWSPDRNGGFSRADPANLVLPTIMDPLYGFEAVNVEAQSRDPHSLLNWTRRMLMLRRDRKAFGRGTQRFLYPGNRKILAYLREHDGETMLCVFNLSRTPQAVELDLSEFAGRVPVEMTGRSPFPPIGQLTYLLTLPPYGFYWFELLAEAEGPAWHTEPPSMMAEFNTLVLRKGLAELAEDRHAGDLSREILPPYLAMRRWFGAKNEPLEVARIDVATPMPGAPDIMLAEVEAVLPGHTERYLLPLAVVWEDAQPGALAMQLALARIRQGRRIGYLTDAFATERFARTVLSALGREASEPASDGDLRFMPTSRFAELDIPADAPVRWLSAEQSNSSLIVGEAVVLKVIRHTALGINPEAEMTRRLTELAYPNIAPLYGQVARLAADGTCHSFMLVQGFIRNQGDAWTWSLESLKRSLDDFLVMGAAAEHEEGLFNGYRGFARTIGQRLGELHACLAVPTDEEAFQPRPAGRAEMDEWVASARGQLEGAFEILRAADDLPEDCREHARAIVDARKPLLAALDRLARAGKGALVTRIHGDFHLGQVLVAQGDAYIIDFEGEPARSLEERRAKTSPMRDAAGLIRSFDYASAAVATPEDDSGQPGLRETRRELLERFRQEAESAFLEGYREAARAAEHPWVDADGEGPLLDLFTLEKVAYEIRYEAANRPKWLPIPLTGLFRLMNRLLSEETAR